jgi:hypothetical protein
MSRIIRFDFVSYVSAPVQARCSYCIAFLASCISDGNTAGLIWYRTAIWSPAKATLIKARRVDKIHSQSIFCLYSSYCVSSITPCSRKASLSNDSFGTLLYVDRGIRKVVASLHDIRFMEDSTYVLISFAQLKFTFALLAKHDVPDGGRPPRSRTSFRHKPPTSGPLLGDNVLLRARTRLRVIISKEAKGSSLGHY